MNITTKLLTLAGASAAIAFAAPVTPAFAGSKPCCYNNGQYFQSSPSTCHRYGGQTVEQEYCTGYGPGYNNGYYNNGYNNGYYNDGYYGSRRPGVTFSIDLGSIVFAYSDGYYDRSRRWHRWRNDRERAWFQQHRRHSYHHIRRDNDRDRNRRDWREGRRRDWN
jgi:hypothetical protein